MLYDVVWGLGKPSSTILSVFFNIVQTHIKNCNIHVQNEGGLSQQKQTKWSRMASLRVVQNSRWRQLKKKYFQNSRTYLLCGKAGQPARWLWSDLVDPAHNHLAPESRCWCIHWCVVSGGGGGGVGWGVQPSNSFTSYTLIFNQPHSICNPYLFSSSWSSPHPHLQSTS